MDEDRRKLLERIAELEVENRILRENRRGLRENLESAQFSERWWRGEALGEKVPNDLRCRHLEEEVKSLKVDLEEARTLLKHAHQILSAAPIK